MPLGERIKRIRKRFMLTQTDFGIKLGVGQSYISALEKGREIPSDTLLILISTLFYTNLEWLREGTGDEVKDIVESINDIEEAYRHTDIKRLVAQCEIIRSEQNINDSVLESMVDYLMKIWQESPARQE